MLKALGALFALPLTIWQPYWIPAGSMKPTLLIGDYIAVRPLTGDVARGDVVVFRHPASGVEYVKRVAGLPGDRVQMRDGVLVLNGAPVPQEPAGDFVEPYLPQGRPGSFPACAGDPPAVGGQCRKALAVESLPGGPSYRVLNIRDGFLDDTVELTVPDGHVYVIGDNRDNALDSRLPRTVGGIGPVPLADLAGRVGFVVFSSAGRSLWNPANWRPGRYMRPVR